MCARDDIIETERNQTKRRIAWTDSKVREWSCKEGRTIRSTILEQT